MTKKATRTLNRIGSEQFYHVCKLIETLADDNNLIPQSSYSDVIDVVAANLDITPSKSTIKKAMETVGVTFNPRIDLPYVNARINELEERVKALEEAWSGE